MKPDSSLLRIINCQASLPEDMGVMLSIKLVGSIGKRSKWRTLKMMVESNDRSTSSYFKYCGKENDKEATFGFFTMTSGYIFVPEKLKAKALVIHYINAQDTAKLILKKQP